MESGGHRDTTVNPHSITEAKPLPPRWLTKRNRAPTLGDGITDLMDMNLSKLWELVMGREAWHAVAHGATEWLNWTLEEGKVIHTHTDSKYAFLALYAYVGTWKEKGLACWSSGWESACSAGHMGLIPALRRSHMPWPWLLSLCPRACAL